MEEANYLNHARFYETQILDGRNKWKHIDQSQESW